MSKSILFIGLGVMGYPMAGHLQRQGHDITAFNRSPQAAQRWAKEYAGKTANDLRQAAATADLVITCISKDSDLQQVLIEQGVIAGMQPGGILVDHSTTSAQIARQIAQTAQQRGLHFLDAPVSGGQKGAENGQLTIMCGGDAGAFALAEPFLRAYGKAVTLMGPSGAGQLTKMANQIAVAGVLQGLAEAIHFAQQAGLDCERVIDVISQGAAQSWQMENRGKTMIAGQYNFGFAVDLMRKDLGLLLEEARNNGASLASTAQIDQFYADVQALGGGRWDTSSLLERLQRLHPPKPKGN